LTYEANPIAFLVEQANGMATNGIKEIMNLDVKKIHQRTALIFGSKEEVVEFKNTRNNI
jgi:fructose-1,6-bisphosphatase I